MVRSSSVSTWGFLITDHRLLITSHSHRPLVKQYHGWPTPSIRGGSTFTGDHFPSLDLSLLDFAPQHSKIAGRMNPPLTAILALVLCPLPLARADDPPAVTAPGPPSFLYVGGGGLYIHWDDRSADEVSFTLHLTLAGVPQHIVFAPNTRSYHVPEYEGSSYSGFVTATNASGSADSASNGIYDPFAQNPDSYAIWRFTQWGTIADAGPAASLADPDHDGYPNLMEFAFNTEPHRATSAPSIAHALTPDGALTLTFTPGTCPALTYIVEFSSALTGPWTTAHSQTGLQNDGLPRAITDPVAPGNSRRFGRIRVIHSSP